MSSRAKISVVPAALLVLLLLAAPPVSAIPSISPPADPPASPPPSAPPAKADEATDSDEETEGESGEEGTEEGEEEEGAVPPGECVLQTAHLRAVAKNQKLELTIAYTAYEPIDVTIELRSGGAKIGSFKRHLGRSGILRIDKKLGKKPPAKRVLVGLRISESPPFCERFRSKSIKVH